ncbi:MAG: hypothetical protein OXH39_24585 [Candidatus Poribacteria bacterium]|nr:hypothetical protein [Candidatus Poribacteria bacterium]
MKTRLLRWVPIELFLFVATISFARYIAAAAQSPCRPTPEICHPRIQPLLCQSTTCPDAEL